MFRFTAECLIRMRACSYDISDYAEAHIGTLSLTGPACTSYV